MISLLHNLSKLLRRDVRVMTPSYWKRKLRYRAVKRFIHEQLGTDYKRTKSWFPGNPFSSSWACNSVQLTKRKQGKARHSTAGFWRAHLSMGSEVTSNSARTYKRHPKLYYYLNDLAYVREISCFSSVPDQQATFRLPTTNFKFLTSLFTPRIRQCS